MLSNTAPVLNPRGLNEERSGKRTPLLEAFRFAESDHVMIDTLPIDAKAILRGVFVNPFQPHPVAALGSSEMGSGLLDRSLEFLGLGRVDGDVCDFDYHAAGMAAVRGRGKL